MKATNLFNKLKQLFDGKEILGIFSFGSNFEFNKNSSNTDIDLLIIVSEKNLSVKSRIDTLLKDEYNVIHHPDFYSTRNSQLPIIEIIVLPFHSKFLQNESKGILTGISGFVDNPFLTISSVSALNELISLPLSKYTLEERLKIIRYSEWGINDYIVKIWPLLDNHVEQVDWTRVIKFLIMDLNWLLDGKMIRSRDTFLNRNNFDNRYESIFTSIDQLVKIQNLNEKEIMVKELFEVLNFLSKKLYEITSLHVS